MTRTLDQIATDPQAGDRITLHQTTITVEAVTQYVRFIQSGRMGEVLLQNNRKEWESRIREHAWQIDVAPIEPEAGDVYTDPFGHTIRVQSVRTNQEGELMVFGQWWHKGGPSKANPWQPFYKTGGDFAEWVRESRSIKG